MTLIEERPTVDAEHNYSKWAWIAAGVAPLVFVVGVVIAFAASGSSASGEGSAIGGALLGLLLLAAPTAALIFAVIAARAEEPAARTVLTARLARDRDRALRHLRAVTDRYWEPGWRREHRGSGSYPEDHLWRAVQGYLDLLDASES